MKKILNAKIISNKKVAVDHFEMKLNSPELAMESCPGQFVAVKAGYEENASLLRIPLGVHKIEKRGISVLYKTVGAGTRILSLKRAGEEISVLGPLGRGFDFKNTDTEAFLVSGGCGIAPLYSLAKAIIKTGKTVEFFIGASEKKHILCVKDLKQIGVNIHVATDNGSCGYKGYVTALLEKYLKQKKTGASCAAIYASGPKSMLKELAKIAGEFKISAQISLDEYIACGIGACFGCAVRTKEGNKLVCKDGPVFDAGEIDWVKFNQVKHVRHNVRV